MKKRIFKIFFISLLCMVTLSIGRVAEAGMRTNKLPNFDTSVQFNGLQGVETAFAKTLTYKTGKNILVGDILKYIYPNKSQEQLKNASASIKDCINYAKSIGVDMAWVDKDNQLMNYKLIEDSISKNNPIIVSFKPIKTEWVEPRLLGVATGYMYLEADGINIKEPINNIVFWFYNIENYIFTSQSAGNKIIIKDPFNPGYVPDKECSVEGYIVFN